MRLIETEIRELKLKALDMADLVRVQLENCSQALSSLDYDLAKRVLKKEKEVDKFDNKIVKRCERIIALYQPVANDLRFVFSILRVNSYLEQVGDCINGIAYRIQEFEEPFEPKLLHKLRMEEVQEASKTILYESLRAYFKENADDSKAIFEMDDTIDEIHTQSFDILVSQIKKEPKRAAAYIHLLHIIKNFEKIGDFAVAIAEEGIFHTEGVMYRHSDMKHLHKYHEKGDHKDESTAQETDAAHVE